MPWPLTPARRRGVELLDNPAIRSDVRARAMADLARSNALFGGTRVVLRAMREVLREVPRDATLIDVGTGLADIPARVREAAARTGVSFTVFGIDVSEFLLRAIGRRLDGAVVGDATRLPLADDCADVVICSQVLHHFEAGDARRVIGELQRVTRGWVVIGDLQRSWFAAAGFSVASLVLRFDGVTRSDGIASVFRGFTARELESLVRSATGARPRIRRGAFWRLSATWSKHPSP